MASINNGDSWVEKSDEAPKKKRNNSNVEGLIKHAVEKRLWVPINPKLFNEFQKDKEALIQWVEVEARYIKYEDPEIYGDIDDTDIPKEKIMERILSHSKNLLLLRERAVRELTEQVPELKWELTQVREALASLNEQNLQNLINKKRVVKNFVTKYFPTLTISTQEERKDFEKIFHDIHEKVKSGSDEEVRCLKIIQDYKTYRQNPGSDDIEFLLDVYSSASNERKSQLFRDLGARVSISFAVDQRLINDDKIRDIARTLYGEQLFDEQNKEVQANILNNLKQSRLDILPVDELNMTNLGRIIQNRNSRKILAEEISKSIIMTDETREVLQESEKPILQTIREKKLKEAQETGIEESNYDPYTEFIDEVVKMTSREGGPLVKNSHNLYKEGTVIQFDHPNHGTQFLRIKKVRDENGNPIEVNNWLDLGIELEGMPVVDGVIRKSQYFTLSYDQFLSSLKNLGTAVAISSGNFDSDLITKNPEEEWKYLDMREIEGDPVDMGNIVAKINLLDPEWSAFWFEEWTSFIGSSVENETGKSNNKEIWTIKRIEWNTVDLRSQDWYIADKISLQEVYEVLKDEANFTRIGKISEKNDDMIKALKERWLDHDAKIDKDGRIIVEETDAHGHAKVKHVDCYISEKWGHIRIFGIKNGVVQFGEFDPNGNELSTIRKHAEQNGYDKEIQKLYKKKRSMSYIAFIQYLESNKLEKADTDPILPASSHGHEDHGHDWHGHYDAHMTGSLFKRMLKWQNPASIMKGFEMLYHSIEHTLEKGSKLDAARFAMATSKFLHLPGSVDAQVYSDITSASKEIVEKYEQKIFGLPGPAGRWKCIHIAHDADSRPEEVAAAINYMLKSYGQLYGEDIKHYQSQVNPTSIKTAKPGYFAFLDAFIITSKIGNLQFWREKAYDRAMTEMGSMEKHEGEPTEEQLIHALMKQIDGKWDQFPYAASVVKAIGGPSGFEKNWKFEGFENAKKKGIEQTQMVNADGRVNKAIGYLKTHEIYKAIGAMEAVAGKSKSPEHQIIPILWCVGWFSQYSSHHALQQIKKYAESGYTFHAFSFMRNKDENDNYAATMRLALEDLGEKNGLWHSLANEFDTIKAKFEFDHNDPKKTEDAWIELTKFWQKWQDKGLHDMLQWHNGWLLRKNKEWNSTVRNYLKTLSGKHQMQLNDSNIPGNEYGKDWFDEHGMRMNRIMTFDASTGLYSLKRMLNKIQLSGTKTWDKDMKTVEYEKLWEWVKEQMVKIRDPDFFGGDLELQKKQFDLYRKEIIDYFVRQLTARSSIATDEVIKKYISLPYNYLQDLRNMGIDPYEIYSAERESANKEIDYNNWKSNLSSGSIRAKVETPNLQNELLQSGVQKKADWIVRKNTIRPTKRDINGWQDEDSLSGNRWGIADASDLGPRLYKQSKHWRFKWGNWAHTTEYSDDEDSWH